ncbi:MAG: hypothetical protein K1X94_24805 [Sandaracinaceae bacterium]|nr:hypothetical protein [Sandaracinaceae bacterium]
MLSPELMGALALGVLWVNTLLIAADALRRRARLGARLAELRDARARGTLVRGRVTRGAGEGDAFATRTVEQVGRAMTVSGPQRILFTDRATRGQLHGGRVSLGDREIDVLGTDATEVWCEAPAERGDKTAFDAAWQNASTFKGFSTTLARSVRAGEELWLWLAGDGDVREARLVSSEDPALVVARARRPLALLALGAVAGAAAVTTVALWPPVFGAISTVGGALALVFFLGIQPLGTAARDKALLPDRQKVGGLWQRPA